MSQNTTRLTSAQLDDVKSRNPCDEIATKWVRLRGRGKKKTGPCPVCSSNPQSRTATRFNVWPDHWACAVCSDGGDVIALVRAVERLDFNSAVAWLGGAQVIDPAVAAERERERAHKRAKREATEAAYRERERRRMWEWWNRARHWQGTVVESYMRLRLGALPDIRVRCLDDAPLFADGSEFDPVVLHRGPAMAAPIIGVAAKFAGLHLTWIDLNQPKGKLVLRDPETGNLVPSKKVRGTKTGGHIVLSPASPARRMIIGEGIEKVAAVQIAMRQAGRDLRETEFRTSVDLGNLGGAHLETVRHPTLKDAAGRARRVPGPDPDLSALAIVIPDSVDELVLLGDSTSDRFLTECALARATKRYSKPGRTMRTAWSPAGMDFDERLIGKTHEKLSA
jgi:hypothetical protein